MITVKATDQDNVFEVTRPGNLQYNALTGKDIDIGFKTNVQKEWILQAIESKKSELQELKETLKAIEDLCKN